MHGTEEKLEEAFTEKLDKLTHDDVALDSVENKETVAKDMNIDTGVEQTDLVDEKSQDIDASVDSSDSSDNHAPSLSDMAKTAAVAVGTSVAAKVRMDVLDAQTDKDNVQKETLADITSGESTVDLVANEENKASETMSDTEEKLEVAFTEKLDKLTDDEGALDPIEAKETVDLVASKADEASEIMHGTEEKLEEAFTEKLDKLTDDEGALNPIEAKETVDLVASKADEASEIMNGTEEKLEVAFTEKLDKLTDDKEIVELATNKANEASEKMSGTEENSLGVVFRRRNMRRFRSLRR